jgi:hypothetical protein
MTLHEYWLLCSVLGLATGFGCGWLAFGLGRRKGLADEFDRGFDAAVDDACDRVLAGRVLRLSPGGNPRWCDAGSQWDIDGAEAAVPFEDVPRPDDSFPGAGPGRTTYPELVALASQDVPRPGQDAEGVTNPSITGPGHPDPHWYVRGQHFLADWRAQWHDDVADWDDYAARWAAEARESLTPLWVRAQQLLEAG